MDIQRHINSVLSEMVFSIKWETRLFLSTKTLRFKLLLIFLFFNHYISDYKYYWSNIKKKLIIILNAHENFNIVSICIFYLYDIKCMKHLI